MSTEYKHPTTLFEFECVYSNEFQRELESCERWIQWCEKQGDAYGINFHQGMMAAHRFNKIKMDQLLCVLKQEYPNVANPSNEPAVVPSRP